MPGTIILDMETIILDGTEAFVVMQRRYGDCRRNSSRTIAGGTGAQNKRTRQHCPRTTRI